MNKYVITTCSTIDLNIDKVKEYNINYLSNIYFLDDKEYYDDILKEDDTEKFYENLAKGLEPKTTQINTNRFIDFFKPYLKQKLDIFHISFSSGLSGTYNSARLAADVLKEEYPNNKIIVIDSLAASSGLGLLVTKAIDKKSEGYSIDELNEYIEDIKLNIHHWFYSTDLKYYVKGGRITKIQGFIGSSLHICPILNVDNNGKLIPRTKAIGKKRVINKILDVVSENINDSFNYSDSIYISNSDMLEDAKIIKNRLLTAYPNVKEVVINSVGPLIGSHTGPGTIAIFFFGEKRES